MELMLKPTFEMNSSVTLRFEVNVNVTVLVPLFLKIAFNQGFVAVSVLVGAVPLKRVLTSNSTSAFAAPDAAIHRPTTATCARRNFILAPFSHTLGTLQFTTTYKEYDMASDFL